jgi:hypothetical protein
MRYAIAFSSFSLTMPLISFRFFIFIFFAP